MVNIGTNLSGCQPTLPDKKEQNIPQDNTDNTKSQDVLFDTSYDSQTAETYSKEESKTVAEEIKNVEKITVNDIIQNQSKVNGKNVDTDNVDEKKNCLKEYFEKLNEIDPERAKKELISLIMNSSDEEKMLLMPVLTQVFKDAEILEYLFQSFSSKDNAAKFADSISAEEFREIEDTKIQSTIVKHMSESIRLDKIREHDAEFEKFYNENQAYIEQILLKRKQGIKNNNDLEEPLNSIADELDKFLNASVSYTAGILESDMSDDKKREAIKEVDKATNKHPDLHNAYLEAVAVYFNNPDNNFNISIDKVKEILDEVTECKFSNVIEKVVEEQSAIDSTTGNFKTPSTQEIEEKKDYLSYLTQQTLNGAQNDEPQSFVVVSGSKENESDKTFIPLLNAQTYNVSQILDIITGKKSDATKAEENEAIESYKLLNTAIQGNLLRSASGKFFNKLLENTKTLTLKLLLATGWKANSFAETQKVKETVEERKQESA